MRSGVVVVIGIVVCACSSSHGDSPADASGGSGFGAGSCGYSSTAVDGVSAIDDLASDGATIYLATTTLDGAHELATLDDNLAKSVVTASADGVYLTSAGSSIVYAARLGGSGYEIHERTPTLDTKLAELPLTSPGLLITTNDTDVFVAGHDAANEVTLWRVSRAGGAVTTLTKRTTSYSLVGQTLAANDGQLLWNVLGVELLDLADVSRPMELEPGSVQAVALAHENVYAYEVTEHSLALEQLTPVPTIINRVPYDGTPLPMAGDFGHLAFGYRTTLSLFDFATNNQRVCPFNPPVVRAGDSTRWLALDGTTVYTIEK